MKSLKLAGVVSLALALVGLVALPVSAAGPIVERGEGDMDYLVDAIVCPGIDVFDHEVYSFVIKTWVDDQGNVLRVESHWEGIDNLYNPRNPEVVLSGHFVANCNYNARTGKDYCTGVPAHITIPGYGTALVRSGRWITPLYPEGHVAGKDSFESPEDMEQFCSYLAGD